MFDFYIIIMNDSWTMYNYRENSTINSFFNLYYKTFDRIKMKIFDNSNNLLMITERVYSVKKHDNTYEIALNFPYELYQFSFRSEWNLL